MIGKNMKRTLFISVIFFVAGCGKATNGWTPLFDGQAVTGMRGYKMESFPWEAWAIEDGSLKTIPGGKGVDIISTEIYKDLNWSSNGKYNLEAIAAYFILQLKNLIVSGNRLQRCRFWIIRLILTD